ncbi:MAG: hypothetical protein EOM50_18535 [Erysipelotrichia bacterium]|nr:hypothetical protein [Erysipelotrichia bacterium]
MDAYDDRIKNIKRMNIEPAKSNFMQFSLSTIESNKILEEINMYVAKRNLSRLIKDENKNSPNEHFLYYDGNKFLYISPTENICLTKEGVEGIDLIEGKDFMHMKYSHSWQYKLSPQSGYYENVCKLVDKLIDIFDKKKEAQKSVAHMHYLKDSNDSKEGNKMYMLPRDHSVDVRIFETLVDARNLSASYKLFWLAGILEEIKQGNNEIAFRKIVCRMLALAWDLVLQHNLNFGFDDKISDIVKLLHNEYNTVEDARTNSLLEFLEKWKKRVYALYEEVIKAYFDEKEVVRALYKKVNGYYSTDTSEEYVAYKTANNNLRNKIHGYYETKDITNRWGKPDKTEVKVREGEWEFALQYINRGSYDKAVKILNKDLEEEAKRKYDFIIERVNAICGQITDASNLKVGAKSDLNGIIIGTKGNAHVKTIDAGGYNIQCFHYRTLINKVS